MALTFVLAYDISEDRRRSRVAATIQQWGDRVQKSVFVCTLEPNQLTELLARVTEMIDTNTDSVYAFRQCAACWETVSVVGQANVKDEPYYWAIL